ncbi:LexA family transcriptional regulator [Desulfovibrio sp. JC022]|uniref:LexA family protein n=1 Tax=Desulfovibrio sp. JC022 TaxID=2593642 RepID=UPI0013D0A04F|nr:translesion error-prone DNA polymerase V autoproteolytic subunit [Desulfovibrio sp. JC022]NDV21744.1 translesion error-prone DNA polymerase V autoproteolytic subunit [Desulfovibrio sp. JC022]
MKYLCAETFSPKTTTKLELPILLSEVIAGFPSPADDYIDKKMDLNEQLISNPAATFLVRAYGDSMLDANINQGDILVVDRSQDAHHNSIIIAIFNGELTVKRLIQREGKLFLAPENPDYPILEITEDISFEVWGVVTYIIHKAI